MTSVHDLVSGLASMKVGPPVVSLYLDTGWRDEQQRDRVRLLFRDRAREARQIFDGQTDDARGLERTLDSIAGFVDEIVNQDIHDGAPGVALFASEPRGLFQDYRLPGPPQPDFLLDTRPRILPLVRVLSEIPPALIVSIDSHRAEILDLRIDESDQHAVERDVPNRHKSGGWSQRRLSRDMRRQIHDVWRESAHVLEQLVANEEPRDVLLFGQEPNIRGFERLLPIALKTRVIAREPAPEDGNALRRRAREILAEARLQGDRMTVRHILRQGLSGRTATTGLDDTLMAVNGRRVRVLAMSERFNGIGRECRICGGLWTTGAAGCVFCNGATDPVALREALTNRCMREKADVIVVPDGEPLDAYHGIGALLRHLSGREREQGPMSRETAPATA
jgi:hypothetical protein